jgi:hypothetical protein
MIMPPWDRNTLFAIFNNSWNRIIRNISIIDETELLETLLIDETELLETLLIDETELLEIFQLLMRQNY